VADDPDIATRHVPVSDEAADLEMQLRRLAARVQDPDDRLYHSENARQHYRRLHRRWKAIKDQLTLDIR
jgi:hypothetical protein